MTFPDMVLHKMTEHDIALRCSTLHYLTLHKLHHRTCYNVPHHITIQCLTSDNFFLDDMSHYEP